MFTMNVPQIQELKETVDIYFGVKLADSDERIKQFGLDNNALSVWVTYPHYMEDRAIISMADAGLSVDGFEFTQEEIEAILQHVEESKENINWLSFSIKYWKDEERREAGISDIHSFDGNLEDLVKECIRLVDDGYVASAEVISEDTSGEQDVYFFCGPDEEGNYVESYE